MCWKNYAECAPIFFRALRVRNHWLLHLVIYTLFFFGRSAPGIIYFIVFMYVLSPPYFFVCVLRAHDHMLYCIYLGTPLIYSLSYLCTHLICFLVHIRLPVCYHLLLLYIWHCPRSYFAKFYTHMVTYGNLLVWSLCTIFPRAYTLVIICFLVVFLEILRWFSHCVFHVPYFVGWTVFWWPCVFSQHIVVLHLFWYWLCLQCVSVYMLL